MDGALVIGGTRFVGRHAVEELLAYDHEVTIFDRGNHDDPFADHDGVAHVEGDRTDDDALERARGAVDPDAVIDCVAYHPGEVRTATDVFADAGAYVYVSTGSVYADQGVPIREDATLHDCPEEVEEDDDRTYGPRKAEGDRAVFAAADEGTRAMAVPPMLVYGPHDYTERFDYWVDRVNRFDRVLVPGDGGSLLHRSYVADLAVGLRLVAESGTAGEAYNVADRTLMTLGESLELIADALETEVEVVTASERELSAYGLSPGGFPLYTPRPYVVDTGKVADLGYESTPRGQAVAAHAHDYLDSDRDGTANGPDRGAERDAIDALTD